MQFGEPVICQCRGGLRINYLIPIDLTGQGGEGIAILADKTHSDMNTLTIDQVPILAALRMYDLLPDILFWVKDADGRLIHANQCMLEHIGVDSLEQAIGLTDYDFHPKHIAKHFIADDQRVMLGELVTDRLELNMPASGEIGWFTTSKRPLVRGASPLIE